MTKQLMRGGFDVSSLLVDPRTGKVDCSRVQGLEHLDFPTPAELCRCCGVDLLRSGCRWCVWFCTECHGRVMDLNARLGAWVIPRGRHTLMHQVWLAGPEIDDLEKREAFVRVAKGLFGSMHRLGHWSEEIVRRNCWVTGLADLETLPIERYLDASANLSREAAFDAMCEWTATNGWPHRP